MFSVVRCAGSVTDVITDCSLQFLTFVKVSSCACTCISQAVRGGPVTFRVTVACAPRGVGRTFSGFTPAQPTTVCSPCGLPNSSHSPGSQYSQLLEAPAGQMHLAPGHKTDRHKRNDTPTRARCSRISAKVRVMLECKTPANEAELAETDGPVGSGHVQDTSANTERGTGVFHGGRKGGPPETRFTANASCTLHPRAGSQTQYGDLCGTQYTTRTE